MDDKRFERLKKMAKDEFGVTIVPAEPGKGMKMEDIFPELVPALQLAELLHKYHFNDIKELDKFLGIMQKGLYKSSFEYTRNCHTPSIELSLYCDYGGKPTPQYTFVKKWIEENHKEDE
jgi:hypothetical protein